MLCLAPEEGLASATRACARHETAINWFRGVSSATAPHLSWNLPTPVPESPEPGWEASGSSGGWGGETLLDRKKMPNHE